MLDKDRVKRKHKKELKSLINKMGNHIIWFESLSPKKQYDVLFLWKNEKRFNKITKPTLVKSRWGNWIKYPPNFKHFIINIKKNSSFRVSKQALRENTIDLILKNKNK
jgi:hypothetical protein